MLAPGEAKRNPGGRCGGVDVETRRRWLIPWLVPSIVVLLLTPDSAADRHPESWVSEPAAEIDLDFVLDSLVGRHLALNRVSRTDLESLHLFSTREIDVIREGRPWRSVEDMVRAIDPDPVRSEIVRSIFFVRSSSPEKRGGFRTRVGWAERGSGMLDARITQRLEAALGRGVRLGLVQEKDPGEASFGDHCAGYLEIRSSGVSRRLILGDYVLRFGQGLLFWPDGPTLLAVARMDRSSGGSRGFCGTTESGFLRGMALERESGSWRLHGFVSGRVIDARVDDTGRITGFPVTGYHRSEKEIREKGGAQEQLIGSRVVWESAAARAGLTFVRIAYSREVILGNPDRDGVRFAGQSQRLAALDWTIRWSGRVFFGEVTVSRSPSFVLGLRETREFLDWVLWIRNLDRFLRSPYGALAMVRRASLRNETGAILGLRLKPHPKMAVSVLADLESRPWRSWSRTIPSRRREVRVEAEVTVGNLEMTAEWKKTVSPYMDHREKRVNRRAFRFRLKPARSISFSCDFKDAVSGKKRGTLARASVTLRARRFRGTGTLVAAWVEPGAPSLYAYSGSLPGEMRFMQASRSGHGSAVVVQVRDVFSADVSFHYERTRLRTPGRWYGMQISRRF